MLFQKTDEDHLNCVLLLCGGFFFAFYLFLFAFILRVNFI